ncbi:MAG: efflux RND transporter periplasmic adaptor subunit [Nannocystaceae bacterium]
MASPEPNYRYLFRRASSRVCAGLFVSMLSVLAPGCGASFNFGRGAEAGATGGTGDTGEEAETPVPVAVGSVERGSISASISSSSSIEAERAVTVHAEATGRIVRLALEEGQEVRKGQLLARLRYDSQSSQLVRASQGHDKATKDLARVQSLHTRGVASDQDLADAQNQLRLARLDRSDRVRDVGNTRVLAPFSGTLTERFVTQGGFVSSGTKLFSLTDFSTLVARVYVPEKELDRIRVGQSAHVIGKAAKGREGMGTVVRIAPIVDAATGTVKITISLPAALSGTKKGFLPGMYAEVTLTTEKRDNVLLLTKTALVREEEHIYAYVVEGGHATRRLLELGIQDDDRVEVLSGLESGDKVVIAGHNGLKDGAAVALVDADGAPLAGSTAAAEIGTDKQNGSEGT